MAAARARLKSKLGNLNSGFDPELFLDGVTLAVAHIESGVRGFSQYAKLMIEDIGDGVKPYLLAFWDGARNYPGLNNQGMTASAEAQRLFDAMSTPTDTKVPASDRAPTKPKVESKATDTAVDYFYGLLRDGKMPKDNNALRALAEGFYGKGIDNAKLKVAQEDLEAAIVRYSRDKVNEGGSVKETFDRLVAVYEGQPNLNIRTSTSVENQAYSTPAPLAYSGQAGRY